MIHWIVRASATACTLLLSLTVIAQTTENAGLEPTSLVAVSIGNGGPNPVDVVLKAPDGTLSPDVGTLQADEMGELDVELGTQFLIVRSTPENIPAAQRKPFMKATITKETATHTISIPDPRALELVKTTFKNGSKVPAALYIHDHTAENGLKKLQDFEPGASKVYNVYPGATFVARTEDGSIFASYQTKIKKEQVFDLAVFATPFGKTVPVKISNFTALKVAVEEHLPGSIVRIAAMDPWTLTTLDAVVGSTLKMVTNGEKPSLIDSHEIDDSLGQEILVRHDADGIAAAALLPKADPKQIPEALRNGALAFLKNLQSIEASNPNVTAYVVFNGGDSPVWVAGYRGGQIGSARLLEPRSTSHLIARTGGTTVVWPGHIAPSQINASGFTLAIRVSRSIPRFIDATPPESVDLNISNGACRPFNLSRLNALGVEEALGQLSPVGKDKGFNVPAGSALIARLGAGAAEEGSVFWRGRVSADAVQNMRMEMAAGVGTDPIDMPRIPDGAEKKPRTVIVSNYTSRPVSIYTIDNTGAAKQMFENKEPLLIKPKTDSTLYMPEGAAMVFRRPGAPVGRSEYGRYRVNGSPNQTLEVGQLKSGRSQTIGAWTDNSAIAELQNNDVGGRFLTLVDTGNGRVKGSTNIFSGQTTKGALLEGCALGAEGYGTWYPHNFSLSCGKSHVKQNGLATKSWGRYRTRLENGKLQLSFGYCDSEPTKHSTWWPLPEHYDDMDPATEGLTHGMMETAWAPPSFEWLGRGFNLLYADPLNFSSTENAKAHSVKPLFSFIYEDAEGRTGDSTAKNIFGVSHINQNAASADCSQTQKIVKTLSDMRDFSSHSYGGSIGVPGIASFSLSKSHSEKNSSSTGSEQLFVMERCDLRLDELVVDTRWSDISGYDFLRQPLESSFRQAVGQLPLTWADGHKLLLDFIGKYGTHFSERVVYGGTFYAETRVKKETFQRGMEVTDGISVEASATVKKVNIGGSYKNESGESRNDGRDHANSDYHKWSVGGGGSKVYETWTESVAGKDKQRAPIQIKFRPIYDLLTPVFFPNDPDIGVKNALLRTATEQYFRQYAAVDITTDPPTALGKRDPKQLCMKMESLQVTGLLGTFFGGDLRGSFVNKQGESVTTPMTIGLGNKIDKSIRPDGFMVMSLDNTTVTMRYEQDAQYGWFQTHCTGPVTADYVWNGSVCVSGTFHINDGAFGGRWNGNCDFSPKLYPVNAIETNIPGIFKDSIVTPTATLDYKLKVWVQ